jgi:hypothetical protein
MFLRDRFANQSEARQRAKRGVHGLLKRFREVVWDGLPFRNHTGFERLQNDLNSRVERSLAPMLVEVVRLKLKHIRPFSLTVEILIDLVYVVHSPTSVDHRDRVINHTYEIRYPPPRRRGSGIEIFNLSRPSEVSKLASCKAAALKGSTRRGHMGNRWQCVNTITIADVFIPHVTTQNVKYRTKLFLDQKKQRVVLLEGILSFHRFAMLDISLMNEALRKRVRRSLGLEK